jgi:hypothetical protein
VEIYTGELLVPESSLFYVETAIAKLERYKSPDSDQILAGGETLDSEIHKLINSIWNKELSQHWKESLSVYKKGDKTDYSDYQSISLLSILYKVLSHILARLSPCIDEITGDH